MKLTTRVVPVAAILLAAGTASAATFSFTNTLGNGLWFSEGQTGPTWFNNWGQSGPASGLPLPGAADIANLSGTVTGNGNIVVATINNPTGATFTHTGGSINAAFSNSGNFGFTGGNRTFVGTWTNTASGTMTFGDGAGWFFDLAGMSLANAGTVNLPAAAAINGGTWNNAGTINKNSGGGVSISSPVISATSGMIMSSSGTLTVNSPTVSSLPAATWVTTAGAVLRLSSPTMSGTFVGNHNGLGAIAGNPSLAANTTLTNSGAGTQPWVREVGSIGTGAFTMTNAGNLAVAGGNQNLSGTFVNSGTITLDSSGWTYNIAASSTFTNTGLVVLNGAHTVVGSGTTSVLNNSGAMTKANGGGSTFNSFTLNNNAGGSINAPNGGITLNSNTVNSSAGSSWSVANPGGFVMNGPIMSGVFNGSGSRFDLNSPSFTSNTTFAGTSGGQWNLRDGITLGGFTVTNTGSAALTSNGGGTTITNGTLNNAASGIWTVGNGAGWTSNFNNVLWTNAGLITISGAHSLNRDTNTFAFVNNGTFQRDGGGTVTFGSAAITNNGAWQHVAASNSATTISGGTFSAGPSSSFTIASGSLTFNSVAMAGTFNANLVGGAGTMNSPTFAANTTLNATGSQPWNVRDSINASGVTVTNIARADLSSNGGGLSLVGSLVNTAAGTMQWSNGAGWTWDFSGASVSNAGAISIPGGININEGVNASTITNTGTVTRLSGGTANFSGIDVNFNASSQFVHAADAGATNFNGATFTAAPGSLFNVANGRVRFSGGTLTGTFNANATGTGVVEVANSTNTAGTVFNTSGSNPWLFTGTYIAGLGATSNGLSGFASEGGGFTLQGAFTNAATGSAVFSNGSGWTWDFTGSTYINNGSLSVPGSLNINGGTINNSGTVNRSSGGTWNLSSVTINNSGLIAQPAGSNGTTTFSSGAITQTGAGTLRVTSGSRMTFNNASRDLAGGRLEGAGTFNANGTMNPSGLTIAPGDANPSVGTLTFDGGNLTLNAGDALEVSLDRPSGTQICDQLRTTSFATTVNVNGANLVVRRPNAGYTPNFNVEYVIIDAQNGGSVTGTFANVVEANPLPGYGYRLTYTSNQVRMKVVRQCNLSDVSGPNQVPLFDGAATADDIIVFLGWYFANDLRADFAGPNQTPGPNGQLTADDIIVFLGLYFQGCGF